MAKKKNQFNEAYNAIGNPGTVFDTKVTVHSFDSKTRHITNSVSQSYDRDVPDISSFRLQAFGGGTFLPSSPVSITLQLTSGKTLPFDIDLSSDLAMFIDGQLCTFSYVTNWSNNSSIITFPAPASLGIYQVTFTTTAEVNTTQAKVTLQVIAAPNESDPYLKVVEVQPSKSRDVTILELTMVPSFGSNSTLVQANWDKIPSEVQGPLVQTFKVPVPAPPSGVWGLAPAWFAFSLEMHHLDMFKDLVFEIQLKDVSGSLLWGMPLKVPSGVESTTLNIPCLDWDDSYLLMQDLFSLGWRQGYFELKITHPDLQSHAVDIMDFMVRVADPSEKPLDFTILRDDNSVPQKSIFPTVWVNGKTYVVLWVETGGRQRQMFVEEFVVDGFAV